MKKNLSLISFLYFLTRLPFLRPLPVFYDSFEYIQSINRLDISNFRQIILSSHQPIHTFYFITALIFKKIFFFLSVQTILVLISLIFGYLTVVVWYLFVNKMINKRIAFFSSLLLLVFPYFFVANTNILYESELLFFQVLSIYLLSKQKPVVAGLTFGFAQLIFIGNLILFPIYLLFIFIKSKRKKITFFLFTISFFTTAFLIDYLILGSWKLLQTKYTVHLFDLVSTNNGILVTLGRVARNIVIQSSAILSIPGIIFLLIALLIIFIRNKKLFLIFTFNILPFTLLQQYWHAGFYGRLSIGLIFPASLIIAYVFENRIVKFLILLLISLSTINFAVAQRQESPIYSFYDLIKNQKNIVIVTSDYNRFLYEKNRLHVFAFKGNNTGNATEFIEGSLKINKTVLIDSQALTYPYYQYDGSFYQILSKNSYGKPDAKIILNKYNLIKYIEDKKNKNIYFLRIINKK